MFREDYIIRLIKQLADFVARIAGYRQKGEFERAQAEIERARDELLGLPPGLVDVLDTPTLVDMLRHPDKLRAAARLFWEEGLVLRAARPAHRDRPLPPRLRALPGGARGRSDRGRHLRDPRAVAPRAGQPAGRALSRLT